MANENVVLKRGASSNLPTAVTPGQILFETDTGRLYIDDTTRIPVAGTDPTKLPLSGGTLTGALLLPASQSTSAYAAVHYQYVNTLMSQNVSQLSGRLDTLEDGFAEINVPVASTTAPKAAGTAAVGTETKWARGDHVHPLQTSVSGNAGTATKLANARTISLAGDVTGSASFDGSGNITITTTASGGGNVDIDDGSIS